MLGISSEAEALRSNAATGSSLLFLFDSLQRNGIWCLLDLSGTNRESDSYKRHNRTAKDLGVAVAFL